MLLASFALMAASLDPSLHVIQASAASSFVESTPLGNGGVGAMLFGGVSHERVVLNESTMWSGSPQDADRPEAHRVLPEIRRLLLQGDNRQAQDLLQKNFVCQGAGSGNGSGQHVPYGSYQTFCDLTVDSPQVKASSYRRVLDLSSAVASVDYDAGGVRFGREAFVSAPAQVFVYRFTASQPGSVSFTAELARKERAEVEVDGSDLVLSGQLESGNPSIPGVRFCGRLRAVAEGGTVSVDADGIHIRGANSATLLFAAGTDMFDKSYDRHVRQHIDDAAKKSFAGLRSEHVEDYRRFFDRCALRLPQGTSAKLPTLDRLEAAKEGKSDPSLAALYFNFGRYLLISSSRPDSPLPANLQGIWAEEYQTPWNADFHTDINVQMNYWPAESTNLSDCHSPLLRFIPTLVPNGEKTARAYYDAPGWVCHVITNPWHFTSPGEGAEWGSTCTGGAWLCEDLWNHYAYTLDKGYLKSVYPTIKGAAQFLLASTIEEPTHHWLVTAPSNSPENAYIDAKGETLNTCMGPAMDEEICRELFGNVIRASEILGIDADFRSKLKEARSKLAPIQVGSHGQIMEWLEDYAEADVHHRHVSPLYALYPADQISPERTPKLAEAARTTLERRGDLGTGWSLAWKVCFWARLGDGDHAWLLLERLFHPVKAMGYDMSNGGGTYPNLFDAHPPFQIDGNFGATAGIAEMLLQRDGDTIRLLPALPRAWATEGSFKGLRVQGNLSVDASWRNGRVTRFTIHGKRGPGIRVVGPGI